MEKEIRKDIRDYILSEVNGTLARLGVSEDVVETKESEDKYNKTLHYCFDSAPIRQMPKMFKTVIVNGYMVSLEVSEGDDYFEEYEDHDVVVVYLGYKYHNFNGGYNGTDIGRMIFLVSRDLPERIKEHSYYVYKANGLEI